MKKYENGFTIIEVVLVLAIAGLIFTIVFLALPQLQRSRRDTQRKTDMVRLIGLLETFYSNYGNLPVTADEITAFEGSYIVADELSDPSTGPYDVMGISEDTSNGHQVYPELGQLLFKARHLCDPDAGGPGTDQIYHSGASHFSIAVWTELEQGGSFCIDNANQSGS